MADTTTAPEVPAAPSAAPLAGEPAAPVADAPTAPVADGGEPLDAAALARELASTRREAATYRTKLKAIEDKDKTESEKAAERIAELERENAAVKAQAQAAVLRAETYTAAQRLGFRNPALAYRLIDPAAVNYGEDGTPKNVSALLQAVVKDDPYLANGTTDYGGGPRQPAPTGAADMNAAIRKAAGRT